MTILVIGATSQIGLFALSRLAECGQTVVGLSRGTPKSPAQRVRWLQGALPDNVPQTGPLDAIVSFGPMDGLASWLARSGPNGARRLVATSSMSAESKRDASVDSDRRISQALRDGEQRLVEECERWGIGWTILRPTLIYGAGLDKSLTPIARRAARWRVFPLPVALGLRQPVHADDVAMAALRALEAPNATGRILPMGGGERLTVLDMFTRVRDSIPVRTLPIRVPRSMLEWTAQWRGSLRGPVTRLEADLVADNDELIRILGVQPRPFRPTAATWGMEA